MTADTIHPCHVCAEPGYRNLAAHGYCWTHYADMLAGYDPASFDLDGFAIPCGRLRPDHGQHYADCRCIACGATWVALPGESCPWCERRRELRDEHQRELLLAAPDVETGDHDHDRRLKAWAERMARGVAAGLVTEAEARRAWAREVARHDAA